MPRLIDRKAVERIHECAVDILSTVGVEFDMPEAQALFKQHGAKVEGKKVFISQALLDKALKAMPARKHDSTGKKRLIAGTPFSNAPMILDDMTGKSRQGNIEDVIKMYQLAETSDLYESVNPGVVDPEGNDSDDPFIAQIAMMLKYSDKWPGLGVHATASNSKNGDVYTSAKKAVQLIKEIRGDDQNPVMGQGICPTAPLSYSEDGLINLKVLVEEEQNITIVPCTLSFMTGPESLMGTVVHDIAIALAGIVYIQLLKPGTNVSFSSSSTMTDMRTMQPVYGSPEYLNAQIMFYEVCCHLGIHCTLSGCLSDGTKNDYQTGYESCLTAMAPFAMTDVEEIWCSPGHMAAFAGGSFHKLIFDEELIINCNRSLQGLNLAFDPLIKDKLEKSLETKSFLTVGDTGIYRKEQRITKIFDKRGIRTDDALTQDDIHQYAQNEIDRRRKEYVLPERSKAQKALLSKYLPSKCKY